jgi:hypothetical protein
MIHIKLGPARPAAADDPMDRDFVGWSPDQTPEQLFARNRGRWLLGARAAVEQYVAFSSTITKQVVLVVAKTGMEDAGGGKWAIVGDILAPGNAVHDQLVGQPILDAYRNPVTYVDHPAELARRCACGCGEEVNGTRMFQPGHDQRAVYKRITARWGGVAGFLAWFDQEYGSVDATPENDLHPDGRPVQQDET